MCYYVSQKLGGYINLGEIGATAVRDELLNRPMVSGFESEPLAVIISNDESGAPEITPMHWGNWAEGITTLNATCEHLFINKQDKIAMWADPVRNNRCLVPVDGYYEYRHVYKLNRKTGKRMSTPEEHPYFITSKSGKPFLMAGFYKVDKAGGTNKVAICTTVANELSGQVHNSAMRMPTILASDAARAWLYDKLTDQQISQIAKTQYDSNDMEAWTVDPGFRKSETPQEPVIIRGLPPLGENQNPDSADGQTLSLF